MAVRWKPVGIEPSRYCLRMTCSSSTRFSPSRLETSSAIADPNPVVFVECKTLYFRKEDMPDEPAAVPLGEAAVLRDGKLYMFDSLEEAKRLYDYEAQG